MIKKVLVVVFGMFLLVGIVSAQNTKAGKALFTAKCAMCHGADGSANTAMGKNLKIPDFHTPEIQKQSDADLTTVIAKGKGKMPAFNGKLTAEQISNVVAHIREIGKQK